MRLPKWRVSPVKYLAYGSNSVFPDSDETYILLMKKPYFDKIIGSSASRQTYFLKGRKYEAPNIYWEVRLHPKLIEANRLSLPGFAGVEDQVFTLHRNKNMFWVSSLHPRTLYPTIISQPPAYYTLKSVYFL